MSNRSLILYDGALRRRLDPHSSAFGQQGDAPGPGRRRKGNLRGGPAKSDRPGLGGVLGEIMKTPWVDLTDKTLPECMQCGFHHPTGIACPSLDTVVEVTLASMLKILEQAACDERRRCAEIADDAKSDADGYEGMMTAERIAEKIREEPKP